MLVSSGDNRESRNRDHGRSNDEVMKAVGRFASA